MNIADVIVVIIIVLSLIGAIFGWRFYKKNNPCKGCNGDCSNCKH